MKTIFISFFVVLTYHQALCDSSPLVTGLCKSLDDIPSSLHNTCLLIHCYTDLRGNVAFLQGGCPSFRTCDGQQKMVQDLNAVYPGCCIHPICI